MRALMAAACVLFLSACGVKGPLYLPPTESIPAGTPHVDVSTNELPPTDDSE